MKLLLLAGTGDARRIAAGLKGVNGVEQIASLAGVTRQPAELACETRVGGFGGVAGFRDYLTMNGIDAVLDATHPFAAVMSRTAAHVCDELGIAHVQMLRPEWQPQAGDQWIELANEAEAATHIPIGSTVFLATGRQTLPDFANLERRTLICRQIDPPNGPFPFANGRFLVGRPPFSVEDEVALFRDLGIDWLVVKNSGAEAARSKLDAARILGLKVAMIERPQQPDCMRVARVEQALDWVQRQVQADD
jgi:precorrin-6A/cobalt-precorrin-6A reductase